MQIDKATFEVLILQDVQQIIEQNLEVDAKKFALRFKTTPFPTAPIATQLKYLQKSQTKLPTYYQHRCIIPPLAYEQCSSELAASLKPTETGRLCLDLTCGLGVDSLHFSHFFEKVISIEQNEVLAQVAAYNFEKMGKTNISVLNETAENFAQSCENEPFDLIYLDPARRDDAGAKIFLPQDCSPNLVELLPQLLKIGKKIVAKLSPLYDTQEAKRQFPNYLREINVVSIENECKEVLLTFSAEINEEIIEKVTTVSAKNGKKEMIISHEKSSNTMSFDAEMLKHTPIYIYEPDVAFYKTNALPYVFQNQPVFLTALNGLFLSKELIADFIGRIFEVEEVWNYKPDTIRKALKAKEIKQINILQRNFLLNSKQIETQLKVKNGGDFFLIFTTILTPEKQHFTFLAKRIKI